MQYQLPQFIEVEDKIIGPFTFRQFVYLAGGAGISYIIFALANQYLGLPFFIAVLFPLPVAILALALAFYKVNNRPFIFALESAVKYYSGSKLYLWKKENRKPMAGEIPEKGSGELLVPQLSKSKLKDIGWNLDVHDTNKKTDSQ